MNLPCTTVIPTRSPFRVHAHVVLEVTVAAFAALRGDGSVVTWGGEAVAAKSSEVRDQLHKVKHVQASYDAFAAILADGSVVTWGDVRYGGDSSAVQDRLKDVRQIQASW